MAGDGRLGRGAWRRGSQPAWPTSLSSSVSGRWRTRIRTGSCTRSSCIVEAARLALADAGADLREPDRRGVLGAAVGVQRGAWRATSSPSSWASGRASGTSRATAGPGRSTTSRHAAREIAAGRLDAALIVGGIADAVGARRPIAGRSSRRRRRRRCGRRGPTASVRPDPGARHAGTARTAPRARQARRCRRRTSPCSPARSPPRPDTTRTSTVAGTASCWRRSRRSPRRRPGPGVVPRAPLGGGDLDADRRQPLRRRAVHQADVLVPDDRPRRRGDRHLRRGRRSARHPRRRSRVPVGGGQREGARPAVRALGDAPLRGLRARRRHGVRVGGHRRRRTSARSTCTRASRRRWRSAWRRSTSSPAIRGR